MLAGLGRRRDADDLAGTALEDQEITYTNVVAGDSHGVAAASALNVADFTTRCSLFALHNYFLAIVMMVMMMATTVNGVQNAISSTFEAAAEGVVISGVVIVAHF